MRADLDTVEVAESLDIAIIGLSGRFPGANNIDEFWQNLRNGVESIRQFTDAELIDMGVSPASLRDPNFVKAGAILENVDMFDAKFFGYSPREAEIIDLQQRIFLECARHAMENAGYGLNTAQNLVGVFAGASLSTYLLDNLLANKDTSLDIDRLGIHDNFFDLGGNSLIGLKVISRLKKELNIGIPVTALFEGPTISALARVISRGQESNGTVEEPAYEENRRRGERRSERIRYRQGTADGILDIPVKEGSH